MRQKRQYRKAKEKRQRRVKHQQQEGTENDEDEENDHGAVTICKDGTAEGSQIMASSPGEVTQMKMREARHW